MDASNLMLKAKALAWSAELQHRLRQEVEEAELGIDCSYMMGSLFGNPGGCDSRSMLADRKRWAHTLAQLYELEGDLGTLNDDWWDGPKKKKPEEKDFDGLFRTPESVQRQFAEATGEWESEQRNEHWNRRKEAEAQLINPRRRFRITRGT